MEVTLSIKNSTWNEKNSQGKNVLRCKHAVFLRGFGVIKVSFSKLVSCFCEIQ